MVNILRIIKDGKVIDESDNLHYIYERLIIYDKKVKDLEIRVAKYK
tara:strand:- start:207 stop:344 length:138 start_codon:yes stop_codon:yes gene_type:complete